MGVEVSPASTPLQESGASPPASRVPGPAAVSPGEQAGGETSSPVPAEGTKFSGHGAAAADRVMTSSSPPPAFAQTPDFLLDVRLTVSVEVGRVQLSVREVMDLGPGAVIELQRGASEPVEVCANGRCIGRGEIVVVGEQFGVRITELGPAA
jgi:flagellar motor switch protein FliN/FliY